MNQGLCHAQRSLLTLGMALLAGSAQHLYATPYAFAENLLTNFRIISPLGSIAGVNGTRNSINTAQYDGLSDGNQDPVSLPGGSDAAQATAGPGLFPTENTFTPFWGQGTLNGSRGDSLILTGNPFTGAGGTGAPLVFNVSESEVLAEGSGIGATSSGRNTSNATFAFTVVDPTTLTFAFDNAIFLRVATSRPGESANASIGNAFNITSNDGTEVFIFTPTTCGEGNLQASIGSAGGVPSEMTMAANCSVSGTSPLLSAGLYSVGLRTTSQVNVQSDLAEIPEPASMVLSGLGIVGLSLISRHRKAKAKRAV